MRKIEILDNRRSYHLCYLEMSECPKKGDMVTVDGELREVVEVFDWVEDETAKVYVQRC
jgi:hypothetical protein